MTCHAPRAMLRPRGFHSGRVSFRQGSGMANDEVNEQGRFWLAGTPIDEGRMFPPDAVDGTLRIDENGRSEIKIDCVLDTRNHLKIKNKNDVIVGYPPQSERFVYLTHIDNFDPLFPVTAIFCLIGHTRLSLMPTIDGDADIEIDLDGFEDWLGTPWPELKGCEDGASALIARPIQTRNYPLPTIGFDLEIERYWRAERSRGKGTWTAVAAMRLKPCSAKTLLELADTVGKLEELLLLFTDRHRSLAWPKIKLQEETFTFYHFSRLNRERSEINEFYSWISFPSLVEKFDQILNAWFTQREKFASSCSYYLATRRMSGLYLEHQFASLVWGLEAMSRNENEISENSKLSDKIKRILDHAKVEPSLKPGDRRWLKGVLDREKEPSLKDRLFVLLRSLPFDIKEHNLIKFTQSCADLRNELSHFAGPWQDKSSTRTYDHLIKDLIKFTPALDLLFHAKILRIIGVPDKLIHQSAVPRQRVFLLQDAGLLPPERPAIEASPRPGDASA